MYGIPTYGHTHPRILRACAINNREWARWHKPAWVRPCEWCQMADFQRLATFTLCKSETLRVYAHALVCGRASESVGGWATPPRTPIFYENCHSHTDSLPRPPLPTSVLPCAHNACVVVPECQRVAPCTPSHAQVRHPLRPGTVLCVRLSLVRETECVTACETCVSHAGGRSWVCMTRA